MERQLAHGRGFLLGSEVGLGGLLPAAQHLRLWLRSRSEVDVCGLSGGPGMAAEDGGAADRAAFSRRSATARPHRARPQMGSLAPPEILMRRGDAGALCDFGSPAPGAAQLCAILLPDEGCPPGPTGWLQVPMTVR